MLAEPSRPRVLLVGDYLWPWYQDACANALESHGCTVERFGWFHDFRCWRTGCSEPVYRSLWHRIQHRFLTGPVVWGVNRRLLRVAQEFRPDVVWFYNVHLITPSTVKRLRKSLPNAKFVQYANDDPFSSGARASLWRHFLTSIPLFDVHFSYRHGNVMDFRRYGATIVHLLRAYFVEDMDYPVPQQVIPDHFRCDVVFAGHYEDDGRVEMLEAICDAGYELNLFGGGWDAALPRLRPNSPLRGKFPVRPVIGADYRYAICGAKVALCFLSTLNRDSYTRRSFQIPAMRTAMLSQYTDDLSSLYVPDTEAVFFRNKQELIEKLNALLADDSWRASIAEAGYKKVYEAGHDVRSRMRDWLEQVSEIDSLNGAWSSH